MNVNYHNPFIAQVLAWLQKYNHKRYWKIRSYVIDPQRGKNLMGGGGKLLKIIGLVYIKKCDAFNNASMGTDLNAGAHFETPPKLPHGMNGIIVCPQAWIGKNVKIFHQVTIGNDYRRLENAPIIEDNVTIYPGAKIVGKVRIGAGSEIGANCVVVDDVPPNSLVVMPKPKIIDRNKSHE